MAKPPATLVNVVVTAAFTVAITWSWNRIFNADETTRSQSQRWRDRELDEVHRDIDDLRKRFGDCGK